MHAEQPLAGGLILSGIPGAGKSTVARVIAERLDRSAHIHTDDMLTFFVSGRVKIREEPVDEAERQVRLIGRNAACVASNFADDDFFPVIEFIIARQSRLNAFVEACRIRPLMLVTLAPGGAIAQARERSRQREVGHMYPTLEGEIIAEMQNVGLWIDNSNQTPEETADEIMKRAPSESIVAE